MDGADDDKHGAPNLAIVFGKAGKGDKPSSRPSGDDGGEKDDDELPPGFEEAAAEAFPDMEGDHDRMLALKRCIHLCSDDY